MKPLSRAGKCRGFCACDLGAIEGDYLFVDRFNGQEAVASISNRL